MIFKRFMDNQLGVLSKFVLSDTEWMWDEWNFFFYFNDVCDFFKNKKDFFENILNQADVVCSLGKSGMVFAAYLSILARKPLIVFSVGEFIHQGGYVIGFTKEEDQFINGKRILVVDSHVRSGNTIKMMNNYIKSSDVSGVQWLTIMDCRETEKRNEFSEYNIKSICDLYPNNYSHIKEIIGDEGLMRNDDFWMKREVYWLGRDHIKLDVKKLTTDDLKELEDKILYFDIKRYMPTSNKYFIPLEIIKNYDLFDEITNRFFVALNQSSLRKGGQYLLVPLTIGALPIAVSLAYRFYSSGSAVRLLYPLFRTEKYFDERLDEVNNYTVILIDDVITTGGIIYAFYDKYIHDKFKNVHLIAPLKLKIGKELDYKYDKYFYNVSKSIIKKGGCVMVGNAIEIK